MTPPLVSIVIPARNEGRRIEECLDAVLAQDYPRDRYEVIVADGLSDDGTRQIVARIAAADPRVRLIDNPGRIVPTGMNRAIAAAAGDFIVRVDGHTIIARDYVSRAIETLIRTGADGAGGAMTPIAHGAFGGAVALATSTPFGVGNSAFHYATEERECDSVYLGAYPRQTFSRFGGYDEELVRNQDDELNYRIRSRGGRVVLNPAIRSSYHPRSTAGSLFSQYFQYGWWKLRVMTRVPSMISWRHLAPSVFVLGLAALAILSALRPAFLLPVALLLAIHAAAALAFCRGRTAGAPRASIALVPVATSIIHLAYGAGLLAALPALLTRARPQPAGPLKSSR